MKFDEFEPFERVSSKIAQMAGSDDPLALALTALLEPGRFHKIPTESVGILREVLATAMLHAATATLIDLSQRGAAATLGSLTKMSLAETVN